MNAYVLMIFLSDSDQRLEKIITFCSSCANDFKYVLVPEEYINSLAEIRKFSGKIRSLSLQPIIGTGTSYISPSILNWMIAPCAFMYKLRKETNPHKIQCRGAYIFIENLAHKFNLSVEYYSQPFIYYPPKHFTAEIAVFMYPWFIWTTEHSPINVLSQYLNHQSQGKFLYCEQALERVSFSWFFWTSPFDQWSWIFLGITVFTISLLLKGQWFEVYAILMRQSCKSLLIIINSL